MTDANSIISQTNNIPIKQYISLTETITGKQISVVNKREKINIQIARFLVETIEDQTRKKNLMVLKENQYVELAHKITETYYQNGITIPYNITALLGNLYYFERAKSTDELEQMLLKVFTASPSFGNFALRVFKKDVPYRVNKKEKRESDVTLYISNSDRVSNIDIKRVANALASGESQIINIGGEDDYLKRMDIIKAVIFKAKKLKKNIKITVKNLYNPFIRPAEYVISPLASLKYNSALKMKNVFFDDCSFAKFPYITIDKNKEPVNG